MCDLLMIGGHGGFDRAHGRQTGPITGVRTLMKVNYFSIFHALIVNPTQDVSGRAGVPTTRADASVSVVYSGGVRDRTDRRIAQCHCTRGHCCVAARISPTIAGGHLVVKT